MKKHIKFMLSVFAAAVMLGVIFSSAALAVSDFDALCDNQGSVMSVAYRGDTALYPANSLEGIVSACDKGADMISVSVQKTADGELMLCEKKPLSEVCDTDEKSLSSLKADNAQKLLLYNADGSVSKYRMTSLEKAASALDGKALLIIDNAWQLRDDVLKLADELDAYDKILLRTDASSKEIVKWTAQNGENCVKVIGIYDGNIIFNAVSHLNRLTSAGQPAVQYQSKNYFNVMYNSLTADRYSDGKNARAVAPMYDKDLCGQRDDNVDGWDEMVARGFSVIETNNISGLCSYISQSEESRDMLKALLEKAKATDKTVYSQVSKKNLDAEIEKAERFTENSTASLGELQECFSALTKVMSSLTLNNGTDIQKGSLNVTAGKIAAAVIFGGLLFGGEVYIFKMKKKI